MDDNPHHNVREMSDRTYEISCIIEGHDRLFSVIALSTIRIHSLKFLIKEQISKAAVFRFQGDAAVLNYLGGALFLAICYDITGDTTLAIVGYHPKAT